MTLTSMPPGLNFFSPIQSSTDSVANGLAWNSCDRLAIEAPSVRPVLGGALDAISIGNSSEEKRTALANDRGDLSPLQPLRHTPNTRWRQAGGCQRKE